MIDPIGAAIKIASSGLETQSARLRIVAENMANIEFHGAGAWRRSLRAQDRDVRE